MDVGTPRIHGNTYVVHPLFLAHHKNTTADDSSEHKGVAAVSLSAWRPFRHVLLDVTLAPVTATVTRGPRSNNPRKRTLFTILTSVTAWTVC